MIIANGHNNSLLIITLYADYYSTKTMETGGDFLPKPQLPREKAPKPPLSKWETFRRTWIGHLSTAATLVDSGLFYIAYTQGDPGGMALTAAAGVLGVYSAIRNYAPVQAAQDAANQAEFWAAKAQEKTRDREKEQQLGKVGQYRPPEIPEPPYQPAPKVKKSADPFRGVGGHDPLKDEEPFNPDDKRTTKK